MKIEMDIDELKYVIRLVSYFKDINDEELVILNQHDNKEELSELSFKKLVLKQFIHNLKETKDD